VRAPRLGLIAVPTIAVAFGLAGLLFGLRGIAVGMLKHVLAVDLSLAFQEVSDQMPVPRQLDWNVGFMQALVSLRNLRGPALAIATLLLLTILGLLFVRIALLEAGPARDAAVPQALTDAPEDAPATAAQNSPRPAPRLQWMWPTVLYAIAVAALVVAGAPPVSEVLLRYYHTLGTLDIATFERLAVPAVATAVAIWSGSGLLLYAIVASARRPASRLAVAGCAAGLFAIAAWCQYGLRVRSVARAYDWSPAILTVASNYAPDRLGSGVPDGYFAAQLLAKELNLKFGDQPEQPARPLVLFLPGGAYNMVQTGYTEDGLTASPSSAKPVLDYLRRRHFQSALSWVAIKHLFNVATVHFDPTGAIEACMLDMEEYPHLSQCGLTTRSMLFTCSATPANLALVDRWGDERRFAHPTRESKRLMGELYERYGETEKALEWYRRADMPRSFMARVQNEKPLFHTGVVRGALLLNGKPLAGVNVGVVPRRLNGLPPDLEPAVLRARGEVIAFRPRGIFPQYYPRPFALRWISAGAVTDSEGRFELSSLTEGEYNLVCSLPPSTRLDPPEDPRLLVSNPPAALTVNYKFPARDLGTIKLAFRP
jgi:hypothetical protein